MKRHYLATALSCLLLLALAFCVYSFMQEGRIQGSIKVGFLFENDEATPYTYNFSLARDALERAYPDRVEILTLSNVLSSETVEPIRNLVRQGCRIVFSNGSSDQVLSLAALYPDVTFCQASYFDTTGVALPENYHSFKGAIHEGRYVSGVAAGMKLRELLDSGALTPEEARVGYVGAFPYPEVISGYTAFLLGRVLCRLWAWPVPRPCGGSSLIAQAAPVLHMRKWRHGRVTQHRPAVPAPPLHPGASCASLLSPDPDPLCLAPQADPPLHLPTSHRPAQRGDPSRPGSTSVLALHRVHAGQPGLCPVPTGHL